MDTQSDLEVIIDYAVKREEETHDFYKKWADRLSGGMKQVLLGFAEEEIKHKEKLLEIKSGKVDVTKPPKEEIVDLKIADYLADVELRDDITYQEALIVAMKIEKASFRLYKELALRVEDENLKNVFLNLAQEEAKHKLWFETEYDEKILKQY